jgi:ketosteroid isomerase-like protein
MECLPDGSRVHCQKFHLWKLSSAGILVLRWEHVRSAIPTVCPEARTVRKIFVAAGILLLGVALAVAQQKSIDDEGGRVLALENAWNHALEAKDAKALDMLLANTFVSIDIDGSVSSKSEFLASIKAPGYQPSQAVTEQSSVQVYGDAAVVVGTFRVKGMEKGKPYTHRERFVDTWIKTNGTWQCVATTGTLITAK